MRARAKVRLVFRMIRSFGVELLAVLTPLTVVVENAPGNTASQGYQKGTI